TAACPGGSGPGDRESVAQGEAVAPGRGEHASRARQDGTRPPGAERVTSGAGAGPGARARRRDAERQLRDAAASLTSPRTERRESGPGQVPRPTLYVSAIDSRPARERRGAERRILLAVAECGRVGEGRIVRREIGGGERWRVVVDGAEERDHVGHRARV